MDKAYISIIGEVGEQVKLEDVVAQTNMHRDANELVFLISGPGGDADEGEDIANHIAGLKQRTVSKNVGDIASIDANIYLAADHRIWDKSKGRFLIHNPWSELQGDSKEFKEMSERLQQYETRIAKFIAQQTGLGIDAAKSLMNRDEFLDNDNLLSLGIAHEIVETEFKAVAKYKPNKKQEMDEAKLKELDEKLSVLDKIKAKWDKLFPVKAIVIQDAAGTEIDFPEVEQGVDPVVGDKATIGGSAADGEFVMPGGETFVFIDGVLSEIKPAEDETEALKQKITELETQLEESNAKTTEATEALAQAKESFEAQSKEFTETLEQVKAMVKSDTKKPKDKDKPDDKPKDKSEVRVGIKRKNRE